jgi:hypothetical protein
MPLSWSRPTAGHHCQHWWTQVGRSSHDTAMLQTATLCVTIIVTAQPCLGTAAVFVSCFQSERFLNLYLHTYKSSLLRVTGGSFHSEYQQRLVALSWSHMLQAMASWCTQNVRCSRQQRGLIVLYHKAAHRLCVVWFYAACRQR